MKNDKRNCYDCIYMRGKLPVDALIQITTYLILILIGQESFMAQQ